MNKQDVLNRFINNRYQQIHCEKCEKTFLTNVFNYDNNHVLLEKRSLGLEYYCGAIHSTAIQKAPKIEHIGIIDDENKPVPAPSHEEIYSGNETDFRFIYIMEKLQHLNDKDTQYFDDTVKDLDWKNTAFRERVLHQVGKIYHPQLAEDIDKLYRYYKQYEQIIAWDLHGDNLMQRIDSNEIVILDPYTRRA